MELENLPIVAVHSGNLAKLFGGEDPAGLAALVDKLPARLSEQRWFIKSKDQLTVTPHDFFALDASGDGHSGVLMLGVRPGEAESRTYVMPLSVRRLDHGLNDAAAGRALAVLHTDHGADYALVDGSDSPSTMRAIRDLAVGEKSATGVNGGRLTGSLTPGISARDLAEPTSNARMNLEMSNTAVAQRVNGTPVEMQKVIRQADIGNTLESEISAHLTTHGSRKVTSPLFGQMAYTAAPGKPSEVVSLLQAFQPNKGDGWELGVDAARTYIGAGILNDATPGAGDFLADMHELGVRHAQMHLDLAEPGNEFMRTEPAGPKHANVLTDSIDAKTGEVLGKMAAAGMPEGEIAQVKRGIASVVDGLSMVGTNGTAGRVQRVNGDDHLGQVLRGTGDEVSYTIHDFGGEPNATPDARMALYSPLKDVAGMVRSTHYASQVALKELLDAHPELTAAQRTTLTERADHWNKDAASTFTSAYFHKMGAAQALPSDPAERDAQLSGFVLEKALYEWMYEEGANRGMNHVPDSAIRALGQPSANA